MLDNRQTDYDGVHERLRAASDPATSGRQLEDLVSDPDVRVQLAIAKHPSVFPRTLIVLSNRTEVWAVMAAIANNPNTPALVLRQLADHCSSGVRVAVAGNLRTPERVIEKLARDDDLAVQRSALANPCCPDSALIEAASAGRAVRTIAMRRDCPAEVMAILSESSRVAVRELVVQHPDTTRTILQKLLDDPDAGIAAVARYRLDYPNVTISRGNHRGQSHQPGGTG